MREGNGTIVGGSEWKYEGWKRMKVWLVEVNESMEDEREWKYG